MAAATAMPRDRFFAALDLGRARHSTQASEVNVIAHSSMDSQGGTMRPNNHADTNRNITPNRFLMVSIHAPAFGSSAPAEAPTSSSGVPMPRLMDNMAMAPRLTSPVCAMNVSAPMSTGATQAETISADSAPITPTPTNVPARWLLLASLSRDCTKLGIWMVNAPNMASASTTNNRAKGTRMAGW